MPLILKHGIRVNECEKSLAKCKDICISNRDELNKELRRTFLGGSGIPPESTYMIHDEDSEEEERKRPPPELDTM